MLRKSVYPEPLRAYIEALVHPAARSDALTAARHRAFISVRLFGGLCVLAAIPVLLAFRGAPTALEALLFAWLILPLAVVAYLSRTGALDRAHLLSAGMLAGVIALVAGATGGVASFAAPWLAVVPLEAALSASRRVILAAIAMTVGVIIGLWALGFAGVLTAPASINPSLYMWSALSAAFYVGAVALGIGAFAESGERVKRLGEGRYHLLAQNMTDVITRHRRNGAVTFVSPAAERLVGVSGKTLMGHGLFDHVHIADRPAYLAALDEAARGHDIAIEYRLRVGPLDPSGTTLRDPSFIWVESRCHLLDATVDSGAGDVVAVTRDVSRAKQDAADLAEARAEAERANEAKSRFLATVSHELRTPLNAIIGFSEMLTNENTLALDAERRKDYARVIRESGVHLLAVVNGILDLSRIEAGRLEIAQERLALAPLVESCGEMLLLRAQQAGLRLDIKLAPHLPEIVADKVALRQVLINLISNAVKFTPFGGSVEVSVKTSGTDVVINVADTGIGISEADLALVGRPFFQVGSAYDRPYEGTGLGLSVVKGLIALHGGEMEIKSTLGEGTRVTVRLPRQGRVPAPAAENVVERLAPRTSAPELGQKFEKVRRSA
jgi:cell cycle sensor histidine kinase DivJ